MTGYSFRFLQQLLILLSISLESAAIIYRRKFALFQLLYRRRQHDRIHDRRTRSLIPRLECEIPHYRYFLPPFQRQDSVVLHQYRALLRCFLRKLVMRFLVELLHFLIFREFRKFQQSLYALVQQAFLDFPLFQRDEYVLDSVFTARHLQFVSAFEARHSVVASCPVRHHYAREPPFPAKDILHQVRVLVRKDSVHFIVRRHHAFRSAFLHRDFKAAKVQLTQSAFVHDRIARHSAVFTIIRSKMLHARRHSLALDSAHVTRRHFSRKIRVFRIIFEVPSAQRVPLDVQPRAQQHVHVHRRRFFPQRFSDSFAQLLVPRTRHDRRRRETRRRQRHVQAQVVARRRLFPKPDRAVRKIQASDSFLLKLCR